jgi:ABC-type branched-subunit amino acid transport system ATPase component
MTSILEVDELVKHFGGIAAVDGVSFTVDEGSITGLIGPNGAGKTTTFNLVAGFYEPDGGMIRYNGRDTQEIMRASTEERAIWLGSSGVAFGGLGLATGSYITQTPTALAGAAIVGAGIGAGIYAGQEWMKNRSDTHRHRRPFQLAKAGLVRTFQITRELQGMTVLENMMLAPKGQQGEQILTAWFRQGKVREDETNLREEALEMLEFLELDHLANEKAGNLSGGQRKLLELGRILMTDPELILLDEPVAGVNPTLTKKLLNQIESLRDDGYTFLIVEHDMEVIMNISDTIIVMSEGKKLMQGPPDEVQQDDRVIDAYLGT